MHASHITVIIVNPALDDIGWYFGILFAEYYVLVARVAHQC